MTTLADDVRNLLAQLGTDGVTLRNGDTAHFSTHPNGTWSGFTGVTRADEIGETNV
jgi:hypothetical protein